MFFCFVLFFLQKISEIWKFQIWVFLVEIYLSFISVYNVPKTSSLVHGIVGK